MSGFAPSAAVGEITCPLSACPSCALPLEGIYGAARFCPRCGIRLADVEQLNPEQRQAAETLQGPLAVIAGAGSGKTRVIEYRVLNLIKSGVAPESILLLTFTRRAAQEMIFRAARHDPRCRAIHGGTFHSFANRALREYADLLHIPKDFLILDTGDAAEAISRCLPPADPARQVRCPKPETLQAIFSRMTTTGQDLAQLLEERYPHFAEALDEITQVLRRYVQFKRDTSCLDYDDLILGMQRLLRNAHARQELAARYRHIMVDEYQDTNSLEAEIACVLGREHGNLMIVGDDAQSIYGFRGADYRNILAFPDRFKGCPVIKLERNYRSTQAILNLANAVLDEMQHRYSKCLRSAFDAKGELPALTITDGEADEAQFVADQVRRNTAAGVELSRQAVLYRSSYTSAQLQMQLQSLEVPFRVVGGPRFTEEPHIKDILCHLRVLVDCHDVMAWGRVLSCLGSHSSDLADQLSRCRDVGAACQILVAKGGAFARLAQVLAQSAAASAAKACTAIVAFCTPILQRRYDYWPERMNDVDSLCRMAERCESLTSFLSDLLVDPAAAPAARTDKAALLTLSTIHSAKGLEWDVVYVVGLSDGVFPDRRSIRDEHELEEERRMLYVAITRARRKLLLSTRGGRVSRFLASHGVLSCLSVYGVGQPPVIE